MEFIENSREKEFNTYVASRRPLGRPTIYIYFIVLIISCKLYKNLFFLLRTIKIKLTRKIQVKPVTC